MQKLVNTKQRKICKNRIDYSRKNTGIPANCNRAVKAAKGEWIKLIAADDILLENCIEDNFEHVNSNSEIKILFSKIRLFNIKDGEKNFIDTWGGSRRLFNSNAEEQLKNLLINDFVSLTPSSFILKKLIVDLNYFDEEFPLIEDYPFWLKCTRNGNKLYYMGKLTVLYRQHNGAVSITLRSADKDLIAPVSFRNQELYEKYIFPYYKHIFRLGKRYEYKIKCLYKNKKSTNINHFTFNLLSKYLNPFRYINSFFFRLNSENEFWMLKKID